MNLKVDVGWAGSYLWIIVFVAAPLLLLLLLLLVIAEDFVVTWAKTLLTKRVTIVLVGGTAALKREQLMAASAKKKLFCPSCNSIHLPSRDAVDKPFQCTLDVLTGIVEFPSSRALHLYAQSRISSFCSII